MKWIFVESWYDEMEDLHWEEYISEDGKLGKHVCEGNYEEIFEICD